MPKRYPLDLPIDAVGAYPQVVSAKRLHTQRSKLPTRHVLLVCPERLPWPPQQQHQALPRKEKCRHPQVICNQPQGADYKKRCSVAIHPPYLHPSYRAIQKGRRKFVYCDARQLIGQMRQPRTANQSLVVIVDTVLFKMSYRPNFTPVEMQCIVEEVKKKAESLLGKFDYKAGITHGGKLSIFL